MTSVNTTFPASPATFKFPSEASSAEKSAPVAVAAYSDTAKETGAKTLLKTLITQMSHVNDADMLDKLETILQQNGQGTHFNNINDLSRLVVTNRAQAEYSICQFNAEKVNSLKKEEISVHTSYHELWAKMAAAIGSIKDNYVDFYADLMQKYTQMYEYYNNYVQKASSNAVGPGDDGNNVNFDNKLMNTGWSQFNHAIADINLGSVKNWSSMTAEQRENMKTTLAPAFDVDKNTGKISFNLDQYHACPNYPGDGGKESTATYQAWLATFNAVGTGLQSNMQSFAQRYSQANSTFDNLNKVLSGAISSLAESAKDVLKSLS